MHCYRCTQPVSIISIRPYTVLGVLLQLLRGHGRELIPPHDRCTSDEHPAPGLQSPGGAGHRRASWLVGHSEIRHIWTMHAPAAHGGAMYDELSTTSETVLGRSRRSSTSKSSCTMRLVPSWAHRTSPATGSFALPCTSRSWEPK